MKPASTPPSLRGSARLLVIDSEDGTFTDARVADLAGILEPGDLLVVNDAATLPASLAGVAPSGAPIEIRLASELGGNLWRAVTLGAGDWRTPTELRDLPEPLCPGDTVNLGAGFAAEVVEVSSESYRLVTIRFNRAGAELWSALYAHGRPVQYAYHADALPLWSVQTVYAGRPWSVEMPSAGRPLTWALLLALRRRGIELAWVTHSAGLSAVGDEVLDRLLPFPETYEIPADTVEAVERARERGARLIAVGTSVVRALEGAALGAGGALRAGWGETGLIVDRSIERRVVDGILTGAHEPDASHFRLLRAFVDENTLRRAWRHAAARDYLCHEFGDLCLIAPGLGSVNAAIAAIETVAKGEAHHGQS